MTVQDFITIWQAQPFRAFRMHTTRGEFDVKSPMGAALTPDLRVAVIVDDTSGSRRGDKNRLSRCNDDGVLEVRRAVPVGGANGPAVSMRDYAVATRRDDRLDRDDQTVRQTFA